MVAAIIVAILAIILAITSLGHDYRYGYYYHSAWSWLSLSL